MFSSYRNAIKFVKGLANVFSFYWSSITEIIEAPDRPLTVSNSIAWTIFITSYYIQVFYSAYDTFFWKKPVNISDTLTIRDYESTKKKLLEGKFQAQIPMLQGLWTFISFIFKTLQTLS